MQRDLLEHLLANPNFTPASLIKEGYRGGLMLDTVNALLSDNWAVWKDDSLGNSAPAILTPLGSACYEGCSMEIRTKKYHTASTNKPPLCLNNHSTGNV